jgi:branched-chain amino acid aminotransferase
MKVFLNNIIVPENEACISVYDRGFLYGDSVFETLRAYGGKPFMLSAHLHRLERSANALSIKIPLSYDELRSAVFTTLQENSLEEAYVRVMVSRGVGPPGYDPTVETTPTLVIIARELTPPAGDLYAGGVKLLISSIRRNHSQTLDPAIKSGNFLNNILAKAEASRAGAYDAIMLDLQGHLAECTSSNIFFVKDGVLHTPSLRVGILDGITRGLIIEQGRERGVEVHEGEYTLERLLEADEVFITNTTTEVMPVRGVNEKTFRVGNMAKRLREAYQVLVRTEEEEWE